MRHDLTWIAPAIERGEAVPISVLRRVIKGMLVHAQDGICPICSEPLEDRYRATDKRAPTIDHVIPLALGGHNLVGNMLAAHRYCNSVTKGGRMPTGCELIWLLAVNARTGYGPQRW